MASLDPGGDVGVVLAGAAALGAYEVGVMSYVLEDLARELRTSTFPRVLAGTSAGAINVTTLGAFADAPAEGIALLRAAWSELVLDETVRPSSAEILAMFLDVTGAPARLRRALQACSIRGGILDPLPVARQIEKAPIARIGEHIRAQRLRGIAISATRVANGEPVVFYDADAIGPWPARSLLVPIRTTLAVEHVLASAAIPLLFPAVRIDGELYCDGGVRQMVPLSPALHLGADRLLVVNPLPPVRPAKLTDEAQATSPLYLAGKAINALFADRLEADLTRLEHTNAILRAGRRRYGPAFEREINRELAGDQHRELHEVMTVAIEPGHDLGALAAEYVRSREFAARARGPSAYLMRWLGDGDPERAGDLLGYLMFDGGFTSQLVALGREDARARHDELCALFARNACASAAHRRGMSAAPIDSMVTSTESFHARMLQEHREIDSALEHLVEAFETGDQQIARAAFREVDARLAAHLKLEDEVVLPELARVEPAEAAQIREEHRAIRAKLDELVIGSDLHLTRLPAIRELVRMLREHAQREDAFLYPWAERTTAATPRASA